MGSLMYVYLRYILYRIQTNKETEKLDLIFPHFSSARCIQGLPLAIGWTIYVSILEKGTVSQDI